MELNHPRKSRQQDIAYKDRTIYINVEREHVHRLK